MLKQILVPLCLLVGLGPVLSGCVTKMEGSKQKVSFSSNPSNAAVTSTGRMLGLLL